MSVIPERHRDELEDEPPDDERDDERRAARHDRDKPAKGWAPVTAADFLDVDECEGCGPGGIYVRYCPIHGLHGTAPR